jgi:hypothetical protein
MRKLQPTFHLYHIAGAVRQHIVIRYSVKGGGRMAICRPKRNCSRFG